MSSVVDTRKIVIACQGGGSHAAYAAGALKRWLPLIEKSERDPMKLVGISGTSGGGLCALLAWYGLLQGGAAQACRKLEAFWHANCAQSPGETLWNATTIAATSALPFDLSFSPYVSPLRDGVDLLTSTWPQWADTLGPFNSWGRGDYFQLDRLIAQQVDFTLVAALGALLGVSTDITRWREADIQSRMKPPLAPADNETLKRQLGERIRKNVQVQPAEIRRLMGPAGFPEGCPLDVALSRWSDDVAAEPASFDTLAAAGKELMAQIPHLLIGAVDIRDGEFVAFSSERAATDGGISLQAVLASAALPWMFKAVEVPFVGPDGATTTRSFWDGLFSQNPPIKNFLAGVGEDRVPAELWVLQINPRDFDVGQLKFDIGDRRNELSGNLSLNQEVSFIEAVNKRITRGDDHKHQPVQVHRVILDRCAIERSDHIKLNALSKSDIDLCPVLLKPRNEISESAAPGQEAAARRRVAGDRVLAGAQDAFHAAKDDIAAPFALAEAAGWIAGPAGAVKTLHPRGFGALRRRLRAVATPPAATQLNVTDGFTFDEQVLFGEVALTMMGLTRNFGRLVVLCGHGSSTENNPYQSALDCGACGGNRGAPNARAAAAILNRPEVREVLQSRGIPIPVDTRFVPAEHDTAVDRVELLDLHLLPDEHRREVDVLTENLAVAGAELAAERVASLPGARRGRRPAAAASHVRARSSDWAQVFPEWGLAGNAAFIVGPRAMTRDIDLQRRTFLHSYDADVDTDGSALETILTAPLVVAQWINCQYYFSTVDQQSFGSGSKTIHNVVGGVGVLSGHNGDLRLGLPWQSVSDGRRLMHEPLRLFAVVQAPRDRIDGIIARNTVLQNLFHHDWVALAARDDAEGPWYRYTSGGWVRWSTVSATTT